MYNPTHFILKSTIWIEQLNLLRQMVEQDLTNYDCLNNRNVEPCADLKSKITELQLLRDLLEQTLKIDLAKIDLSQESYFVEQFQKNQAYYQYIVQSTNSLLVKLEAI